MNCTELQFWTRRIFHWECSHWKSANWTEPNWTDLNKSTQLHDAFISHARQRQDCASCWLAACSETKTVSARSVLNACRPLGGCSEFSSVCVLWTSVYRLINRKRAVSRRAPWSQVVGRLVGERHRSGVRRRLVCMTAVVVCGSSENRISIEKSSANLQLGNVICTSR